MEADQNHALDALFDVLAGHEAELGSALMHLEVGPALRRMPGRETFLVDLADPRAPRPLDVDGDAAGQIPAATHPAVVKRYWTSDAAEARAELLRGRFPRSPARREAENLVALAALGLSVPGVLYFCESGSASLVVLEYVPHARHLRDGASLSATQLAWLADFAAELHAGGWYHRDLYLNHVLETAAGELVVIDVGRARHARRPRRRWLEKDLGALLASSSLALDGRADPRALRWLATYLAQLECAAARGASAVKPPRSRQAKRRFLRGILRRARHMRAHTPRHDHRPHP